MITVRKAGLSDLSAVVAFGKAAVERSNYAAVAPFNSVATRQFLKGAMIAPDMAVFIARRGDGICGVLVATVDVVFFSHVLLATDLAFAATAGGDRLVDAFVEWARTKRAVLVEMMSSQDEKFEQFGRLLRRKGFTRSGSAYRLNLKEGAR